MECSAARRQLSEGLETGSLHESARRHVEQCSSCAGFEHDIEQIRRSLRFQTLDEPYDVVDDVIAALGRRRRSPGLPALLAASITIVVIGAVALLSFVRDEPAPSVQVLPFDPANRPNPSGDAGVLLAWSPSPMSAEAVTTLATRPGVVGATVAAVGRARMTQLDTDLPVLLEILSVDTDTFPALAGPSVRQLVADLAPGSALLSSGTAEMHDVSVGQVLQLNGHAVTIAAIVPSNELGGAEIAVGSMTAAELGVESTSYAVVGYEGDSSDLEAAVRSTLDTSDVHRLPDTEAWSLAGGGLVPSGLQIKQWYGQLPLGGTNSEPDLDADANASVSIVTRDVTALGELSCNEVMIIALDAAMTELAAIGGTAPIAGDCHRPVDETSEIIDRHPWGIAVQLNPGVDEQDPLLIEVMRRWGFVWGGDFFQADPSYFEYTRPPPIADLPDVELTDLADSLRLIETDTAITAVQGEQLLVLQRRLDAGGQIVVSATESFAEPASDEAPTPGPVSLDIEGGIMTATTTMSDLDVTLTGGASITESDLRAVIERLVVDQAAPATRLRLPEPPDEFETIVDEQRDRSLRYERRHVYIDSREAAATVLLRLVHIDDMDDLAAELAVGSSWLSTDDGLVRSGGLDKRAAIRLGQDLMLVGDAVGLGGDDLATMLRGAVFAAPIEGQPTADPVDESPDPLDAGDATTGSTSGDAASDEDPGAATGDEAEPTVGDEAAPDPIPAEGDEDPVSQPEVE